jgi:hypothetical protein
MRNGWNATGGQCIAAPKGSWMNFICRIIGHRRSARQARRYGDDDWRSVCKTCGTPMVRMGPGKWIPSSEYHAPMPTSEQSQLPFGPPAEL